MKNKIEDKLRDLFSRQEKIILAFLFGSQARDRGIEESDVDIAVWPREDFSREDLDSLWREVEKATGKNADLVLLNKARPTVAWSALRGRRLLIRDFKLYLKLVVDVSREAEDLQDFVIDLYGWRKRLQEVKS